MCGIVSIKYRDMNPDLGKEAAELLKRLEYRGYDSTGAAVIGPDGKIELRKKVGSPTKVTRELDIYGMKGVRFIGQVRWATFGAVTDVNSQPHHVKCKTELVGAHNGNITNTDTLKEWLSRNGHDVKSDNDGEILVHVIEDFYAENLKAQTETIQSVRRAWEKSGMEGTLPDRAWLLIDAIRKAEAKAVGSYAAACADPAIEGVFAVKSGSSLYAGKGQDAHGDFIVISSDLTSVLSKTRTLIPLSEGEAIYYTHDDYAVFTLHGELTFSKPQLKRSKLNVKDTALSPGFTYYMEQEIRSSPANVDEILRYYFADPDAAAYEAVFEEKKDAAKEVMRSFLSLYDLSDDSAVPAAFAKLASGARMRELTAKLEASNAVPAAHGAFVSDERELLSLIDRSDAAHAGDTRVMDALFIWKRRRAVTRYLRELVMEIQETRKNSGRVFFVASGTSYHASLVGAWFHNALSDVSIFPCTPGLFRSLYLNSLKRGDLIVGITQSGETKDLVDVMIEARQKERGVKIVSIVNNENSRIPQELSDFFLPILCGPEVAVAATKSFVSQLAIMYLLAASATIPERVVAARVASVGQIITRTLEETREAVMATAEKLAGKPSIHILGTGLLGIAKEGALKIREVVLNHTEGYDAAEFKHGPNTILGKNTIFGLDAILPLVKAHEGTVDIESLFSNYPLVFVCPPDEHDLRITISQVHTHKIRGADVVMIAERDAELEKAVGGKPSGIEAYYSSMIAVPATGDPCLFVFAATAVLQELALRMSVLKMKKLDALGVRDHGVHPDTPKNVSKSITVD